MNPTTLTLFDLAKQEIGNQPLGAIDLAKFDRFFDSLSEAQQRQLFELLLAHLGFSIETREITVITDYSE